MPYYRQLGAFRALSWRRLDDGLGAWMLSLLIRGDTAAAASSQLADCVIRTSNRLYANNICDMTRIIQRIRRICGAPGVAGAALLSYVVQISTLIAQSLLVTLPVNAIMISSQQICVFQSLRVKTDAFSPFTMSMAWQCHHQDSSVSESAFWWYLSDTVKSLDDRVAAHHTASSFLFCIRCL